MAPQACFSMCFDVVVEHPLYSLYQVEMFGDLIDLPQNLLLDDGLKDPFDIDPHVVRFKERRTDSDMDGDHGSVSDRE